jgi:hypothetical protein
VLRRRRVGVAAALAVLGPGLLAGLSDDDPAGITTYSILGAQEGYRLLWVPALSTIALVVYHALSARTVVEHVLLAMSTVFIAYFRGRHPRPSRLGRRHGHLRRASGAAVRAHHLGPGCRRALAR